MRVTTRLAAMSGDYFAAQGAAAAALLEDSTWWEGYETLFIFLSMAQEIDTRPLLESALAAGKRVFAPRLAAGGMSFRRVYSSAGPWERGSLGVREPGETAEAAGAGDFPALLIVPGLAFDREGRRLGRGRGFYDRFLAELDDRGRPFRAAGFCTACQLVEEVPVDRRDRRVDGICTGEGLILLSG
ncbi:MAG: 5-formyltetrahydrofolate cyclo-ligase [Treponema sp.]|jgi:5-formyltetrahydrofolate cyclo-ligase|nr:5-formyltetrahydrofolate cyclo-ligase [Treponema sp.]